MILFVGWFGFNPGSELAVDEFVMQVGVKTLLACCSGAVIAMIVNWSWDGTPDVSRAVNRILDGRAALIEQAGTAPTPGSSILRKDRGWLVVCEERLLKRVGEDFLVGEFSDDGGRLASGTCTQGS